MSLLGKYKHIVFSVATGSLLLVGLFLLLNGTSQVARADPGDLFVSSGSSGDCSQAAPCDPQSALRPATNGDTLSTAIGRAQPAFHAIPRPDGFHADNATQTLSVDFTKDRVTIRSGLVRWDWRLTAYGYGNTLVPAGSVEPIVTANRVEYRRGSLTEWYINGPLGLQQGFDLTTPPSLEQTGEPLTLLGNFSGSGQVELAGERSLNLTDSTGKSILDYTGLLVYDAAGRKLQAWLELEARQLKLRIDDRGATYPLHIDPWVQKARLTVSDGMAFDRFGKSVAISGHTAVIGVPHARVNNNNGQGAVYIFDKPGGEESTGQWESTVTALAKLTAADGAASDLFGFAVAKDDDVIVVTASNHNDYHGAAYVFTRPPGGWVTTSTYTAKLTASDAGRLEGFGWSVGISGDTIIVGAQADDDHGAAYIFVKPENGWSGNITETAKLTASDENASHFGAAVDISGNTVIVGAYATRVGSNGNQGAAYIFTKPENGWGGNITETARLTADDGEANDWFADSVAISGDTTVVGTRYGNPFSA